MQFDEFMNIGYEEEMHEKLNFIEHISESCTRCEILYIYIGKNNFNRATYSNKRREQTK